MTQKLCQLASVTGVTWFMRIAVVSIRINRFVPERVLAPQGLTPLLDCEYRPREHLCYQPCFR